MMNCKIVEGDELDLVIGGIVVRGCVAAAIQDERKITFQAKHGGGGIVGCWSVKKKRRGGLGGGTVKVW